MEALKLLDFMLLATLKGAPAQIIQPLVATWSSQSHLAGFWRPKIFTMPGSTTINGRWNWAQTSELDHRTAQLPTLRQVDHCHHAHRWCQKTLFKPVFLSFSILGRKNHEKSLEPEKHPQGDKLEGWLSRFDSHWVLVPGWSRVIACLCAKRSKSEKEVRNTWSIHLNVCDATDQE